MADFSAKCSTLDNQHKSCGDSRSMSYQPPLLRDIPRVTDLDEKKVWGIDLVIGYGPTTETSSQTISAVIL